MYVCGGVLCAPLTPLIGGPLHIYTFIVANRGGKVGKKDAQALTQTHQRAYTSSPDVQSLALCNDCKPAC